MCGPAYSTWSDGTRCQNCPGPNTFCDAATGVTTGCSSLNYGFYGGICVACLSNYFHADTSSSPCNCPIGGHCSVNNGVFVLNTCDPGFANSGVNCGMSSFPPFLFLAVALDQFIATRLMTLFLVPCGAGTWADGGAATPTCKPCFGIDTGQTLRCDNTNGHNNLW